MLGQLRGGELCYFLTDSCSPWLLLYMQVAEEEHECLTLIFIFNSDQHVHACLLLPAVANGLPPHVPPLAAGASAPQSVLNLVAWLDKIIRKMCKKAVWVCDEDENVMPGNYTSISNSEYGKIVAALSNLMEWTKQVDNTADSLGHVLVHFGGGVGISVYTKLGPFNGRLV